MDFQQIRDFVNPAVAQATGLQEVENLSMPVPVAYVPVQLVIDGALSLTSENPVQNKVIAVAIQNLDGRITAIEGQFSEGVTEAVNNWLAAHPEATTTVQDGAITYAKLDTNLKGEVDQISDLKSAIAQDLILTADDFEPGAFNVYGSNSAASDTYQEIRSRYIKKEYSKIYISLVFQTEHPLAIYGCAYDENKNAIPGTNLSRKTIYGTGQNTLTAYGTFEIPDNSTYFRIFFRTFGESYTLNIIGMYKAEKVISEIENQIAEVNEVAEMIVDSQSKLSAFYELPCYNATYYSGGVKEWGITTNRIINTQTISFSCKTKVTAINNYEMWASVIAEPKIITGNGAMPLQRTSNAWVTEFEYDANENIFILLRKMDGSAITPADWQQNLQIEKIPLDIVTLQERLESVVPVDTLYKMSHGAIEVVQQGYNISKLSYTPQESTGKLTQGMAISNGVVFQGFGNGYIDLYDFITGELINSFNAGGDHCGSLSFSTEYYDTNDEFPLLYVASGTQQVTYVYRITRTSCTKIKTYSLPTETGGYLQETAIDKADNTLWSIGHKANSYASGEGWIVAHWNIDDAVLMSDNIYEPVLISSVEMPWIPYLQYVQCFNGQLIAGTGSDSTTTEEQNTHLYVVNQSNRSIVAVMDDFPANIKNAENEGCDFVLGDNGKYYMILCARHSLGYYKITF